jgi:hypothetical protein
MPRQQQRILHHDCPPHLSLFLPIQPTSYPILQAPTPQLPGALPSAGRPRGRRLRCAVAASLSQHQPCHPPPQGTTPLALGLGAMSPLQT